MSTWDEANGKGSVHFGEHATDNVVDYVRYSSGPPRYETAHQGRNLVWGSNISGSGPGVSDGGPYHSLRRILSVPRDSTLDQIDIRNRLDDGDGTVQLGVLKATFGADQETCADVETCLPDTGAIRVVNGRGITSRSIGTDDMGRARNIEIATTTSDGDVKLGEGANALDIAPGPLRFLTSYAFANLPAADNGTIVYCSDCKLTNPCEGDGTGAFGKRLNGSWVCD
jgi:hypothetical protein